LKKSHNFHYISEKILGHHLYALYLTCQIITSILVHTQMNILQSQIYDRRSVDDSYSPCGGANSNSSVIKLSFHITLRWMPSEFTRFTYWTTHNGNFNSSR